ncbi:MAG: hypothetical protein R3F11_07985 [Verrucomicrobiales bacterium]
MAKLFPSLAMERCLRASDWDVTYRATLREGGAEAEGGGAAAGWVAKAVRVNLQLPELPERAALAKKKAAILSGLDHPNLAKVVYSRTQPGRDGVDHGDGGGGAAAR